MHKAATPVASDTALLSSGHRLPKVIILFMMPLSGAFCDMFYCVLPQALGLCSSHFPSCPPVIFILFSSQNITSTVSVLEFICCSNQPPVLSLSSCSFPGLCQLSLNPAPHTLPFSLPLGCPFSSCIRFFYLHCSVCCAPPWLPLSFPQCLPFSCFQQGGSELCSITRKALFFVRSKI